MENNNEQIPIFDEHDNIVGWKNEEEAQGAKALRADGSEVDKDHLLAIGLKKSKEFVALEKQRKIAEGEVDDLKDRLSAINKELQLVFSITGTQQIKIDGRSVFVKRDVYASAKREEGEDDTDAAKSRLFEALRQTGHGALVKEDVNGKTLASLVREFDPDKTFDPEIIAANMPQQLRDTIKVSVVPKMSSRKG